LLLLAPVPLAFIQPVFNRIVGHIARKNPAIFSRMGNNAHKSYLIDPLNLPFAMILKPAPRSPEIRAVRRPVNARTDARIAGTFLSLLDLVDGRVDGDALFFSRELVVEGDTEAVVALRNALDDHDGSIGEDVAAAFAPPVRLILDRLRKLRGHSNDRR
jgi:predicted lipid carrier protein YhbT